MADILKRFENEIAFQKASKGEETGPASRILSNASILVLVYLLVTLLKDQLYIPALILLVLGFTRFGHWVSIGLAIYFIIIRYWTGVILMIIFGGIGWTAAWLGMRNIKKNLYSNKARVDPFEGMGDLIFILIFQAIFFALALLTSGVFSIIFWVLFGVVTVFEIGRFYQRLSSPWKRLHFPLMVRYAAVLGYQTAITQREGKDFDINQALREFTKNIYPNWTDEEISEFLDTINEKIKKFIDREDLTKAFKRDKPSLDSEKLRESLDKIEELLNDPKEKGLPVRWLIAEIVERDYGEAERIKYLQAIITGQAY